MQPPSFPDDLVTDQIDRKIRALAVEFFDIEGASRATEADFRQRIAWLVISEARVVDERVYRYRVARRPSWSSRLREDIEDEARDFLERRILAVTETGEASNRRSDLDLEQVATGASAVGWARMLLSSALPGLLRDLAVKSRETTTSMQDERFRQRHQVGASSEIRASEDPQEFDRSHDLLCSEAAEMVEVMSGMRTEDERRTIYASVVAHLWGFPFPWPQPSHVREWAETNLNGPSAALQVLDEVGHGEPHPLAGLFDGWTFNQINSLAGTSGLFALMWMQSAASLRLSPSRREITRLVDELSALSDDAGWRSGVRRFTAALQAAMGGATRVFGHARSGPKLDSELSKDHALMRELAAELSMHEDCPVGADPDGLIAFVQSALVRIQYEMACEYEDSRIKHSKAA